VPLGKKRREIPLPGDLMHVDVFIFWFIFFFFL